VIHNAYSRSSSVTSCTRKHLPGVSGAPPYTVYIFFGGHGVGYRQKWGLQKYHLQPTPLPRLTPGKDQLKARSTDISKLKFLFLYEIFFFAKRRVEPRRTGSKCRPGAIHNSCSPRAGMREWGITAMNTLNVWFLCICNGWSVSAGAPADRGWCVVSCPGGTSSHTKRLAQATISGKEHKHEQDYGYSYAFITVLSF
jgi:hypothetical protein